MKRFLLLLALATCAPLAMATDDISKVNGSIQTQAGSVAQERTTGQLNAIRDASSSVCDMMQEIASTNAQQSATATHLAERMGTVAEQIDESHHHVENANATLVKFSDKAHTLARLAKHFQLEDN